MIPQTDTALYMNIYITIEWLFVPVVPFNWFIWNSRLWIITYLSSVIASCYRTDYIENYDLSSILCMDYTTTLSVVNWLQSNLIWNISAYYILCEFLIMLSFALFFALNGTKLVRLRTCLFKHEDFYCFTSVLFKRIPR